MVAIDDRVLGRVHTQMSHNITPIRAHVDPRCPTCLAWVLFVASRRPSRVLDDREAMERPFVGGSLVMGTEVKNVRRQASNSY